MSESEKLALYKDCVCICPVLYNNFSICTNYPNLCGKAKVQNIAFAREHMLKLLIEQWKSEKTTQVHYIEKEYEEKVKSLENMRVVDCYLTAKGPLESYEYFLEFVKEEYPDFGSCDDE